MINSRRNFIKKTALSTVFLGTGITFPFGLFSQKKERLSNKKMKLRFRAYDLQLKHTFTISKFSRTTTPVVLTEIEYDGVVGYGEASLPPYLGESQASVVEFLKRVNLTQFSSPFELEDILFYVDRLAENNTAAKASVDIALHDLVGKLMGQPWHKIWGFDKSKAPSSSFTIGIDSAEVVKEKTLEAASAFNVLKVKLGKENTKEMITAIRSVTDKPLIADPNQAWGDKHYALDMAHWLKEQGVVMIEEPMLKNKLDDTAWLTERSPIPIIADESFQRLSDLLSLKGAYHGVNIKLMKCTGMREARKILTVARAANMQVMVGCMTETSCAISAASQLSPQVDWADLDGNLLITNDVFEGTKVLKGKLVLSEHAGIGVKKL